MPKAAFLHRPGLLFRLSSLIVAQAVFVFGALAIVLFWPPEEISVEADHLRFREAIEAAADRWVEGLAVDSAKVQARDSNLITHLDAPPVLLAAGLFECSPGGPCRSRAVWVRPQTSAHFNQDVVYAGDPVLLHATSASGPGFHMSIPLDANQTLWYLHPKTAVDRPYVFLGVLRHDLILNRASDLQRTLVVLFLVTLLLSLLLAYLIRRKISEPLDRLQHRLEKAAEGEVRYYLEPSADADMAGLLNRFNRIADTLWHSRVSLKTSTRQLRESNNSLVRVQQFLSTLIDSSPIGVLVAGPDQRLMIVNTEAARWFDMNGEDMLGTPVGTFFNRTHETFGAPMLAHRDPTAYEAICYRRDGSSFPAYVVTRPVQSPQGQTWAHLYLVRDISESRSFQEMMVRLDRYYTRGQMAGDIAHEINNYLAVLGGNLELLPLVIKKGDAEKLTQRLDLMRSTVERIARFADGLMDSSSPEELRPEPVDINQIVANVIVFLSPQNKFDAIAIEQDLAPDLPIIKADSGRVQQLLVNLIYNAADALAGREAGRQIKVRTFLSPSGTEPAVCVQVRDNGPGVPDDKVAGLFQQRFTTKRKGHGIGLITCQRIVAAHGGQIRYVTDNGAVFEATLPARRAVAEPVPVAEAAYTA